MGDLSKHFSRHEFECQCGCGQDTVDAELIYILEELHEALGDRDININSGNRCLTRNNREGGSLKSQHRVSRAADITVDGWTPGQVQTQFNTLWPDDYGMGSYEPFTHVDSRFGKARWPGWALPFTFSTVRAVPSPSIPITTGAICAQSNGTILSLIAIAYGSKMKLFANAMPQTQPKKGRQLA